jgi:N6-L-threonylcarbamoyladenine synthase
VAANQYINNLLKNFITDKGITYHQVPMAYCTDNAAMIGWNAIEILKSSKNKFNNYNVRPSPNTLIHENF